MIKKIKQFWWQILVFTGVIGGGIILGFGEITPDYLKIKTTPDKILAHEEVVKGGENYVVYKYISNELVETEENEILEKRTDNARVYDRGGNKYMAEIYTTNVFYKENGKWLKIKFATTTKEEYDKQTTGIFRSIYADSSTFNSVAGDGDVTTNGAANWAAARDAATGGAVSEGADANGTFAGSQMPSATYGVYKGFFPFWTGKVIPSGYIVSSSSLKLFVTSKTDTVNDGYDYMTIVQTRQNSTSTLAAADFYLNGSSTSTPAEGSAHYEISTIPISNIWWATLDSTGNSWVADAGDLSNCGNTSYYGWTCLGLRSGNDIANVAPGAGLRSRVIGDWTEGTNPPSFAVDYSAPPPEPAIPPGIIFFE